MGYDLHITRAGFWAENEGHQISSAEWLDLIETDAQLRIDARNGALFAEWQQESPHCSSWFDWADGNIYTKNPDRNTFAKMLEIADRLGAIVQGDEGEIYTTLNDYPKSSEIGERDSGSLAGRENSWSQRLKRELRGNRLEYIIVALVVLIYVLYDLSKG